MTRTFSGDELVIATHNKGKVAELAFLFRDKAIRLRSAADYNLPSPEETGTTFIENAKIKAQFVAKATGKPALADDSGFCIDALGGAPGVYTAEWEEVDGVRTSENAQKKIAAALGDNPNRKAQFVSVLALCWPDGHCEVVEGIAHGQLVLPPRGTNGFGQDPIFMPDGETRTFAEMSKEEKEKFSHRAKAFRLMMDKCFR